MMIFYLFLPLACMYCASKMKFLTSLVAKIHSTISQFIKWSRDPATTLTTTYSEIIHVMCASGYAHWAHRRP